VPWSQGFTLVPQPVDEAERRRWAVRSDPKFKAWLRDADAKAAQFEAMRRETF